VVEPTAATTAAAMTMTKSSTTSAKVQLAPLELLPPSKPDRVRPSTKDLQAAPASGAALDVHG